MRLVIENTDDEIYDVRMIDEQGNPTDDKYKAEHVLFIDEEGEKYFVRIPAPEFVHTVH